MSDFLKPVSTPINTRQEIHTLINVNNTGLTYSLCDRNLLSDKNSNYFISFNLPYRYESFSTGNTLSILRPEFQQLNIDRFILCNIPSNYYNELIDGRSITFTIPQISGNTSLSAKTIISSSYTNLEKTQQDDFLGTNIAYFFCDEINLPYSGTIQNNTISKSGNTSWNSVVSYVKRPAATSYKDLKTQDINTDKRPNINYSVNVPNGYPTQTNQGYNYDIPVGFAALDKGFFIITHPSIVNNFPFTLGQKIDGTPNSGPTSGTSNIYFSSATISNARFVDIDVNYKTSIMCYIMPGEFFKSTNPSYDQQEALSEEKNGTNGYDPVYLSEIALHNLKGEIIAYAKLDRPLKKIFSDFCAFTIDLNV